MSTKAKAAAPSVSVEVESTAVELRAKAEAAVESAKPVVKGIAQQLGKDFSKGFGIAAGALSAIWLF